MNISEERKIKGILISTGEEFIFPESKLADFIAIKGMESSLEIETLEGDFLVSTIGPYIRNVVSLEYNNTFIEKLFKFQLRQATPVFD